MLGLEQLPVELHVASATGEVYALVLAQHRKPERVSLYVDPDHLDQPAPTVGVIGPDSEGGEAADRALAIAHAWLERPDNRQKVVELFRQVVLQRTE